jgi:hypothetical protein
MEKIKKYKIDFIGEELEKEVNNMCNDLMNEEFQSFILNKKSVAFSAIEKIIYDTCKFHCYANNISFVDEDYNCEFWVKRDLNSYGLHFDYDDSQGDERANNKAYLTILTSLTDSMVPTIITNHQDTHNNVTQPALNLILPEKNSQISFDGGLFFHGSLPFDKEHMRKELASQECRRTMLVINIWKEHMPYADIYYPKPLYKKIYETNKQSINIQPKILNNLRFDALDRESYSNLINCYTGHERDLDTEYIIKLIEPFYKVIQNYITRSCDIYTIYYPIHKNYLREDNSYELIVIAVASDENHPGYKNYIHQLDKFGIKYKTLGLNKSWEGGDMEMGMGGGYKINLLKEELSKWDINTLNSTMLLFTDSYDVLINSTDINILNRYYDAMEKYNKHNCVLFSAEKECWPDASLACKYPNINSVQLYLNSGGFIGSAHNIYSLIHDDTVANTDDDQLYFTNIYLNDKFKERITLDYNCYLFQTLNDSLTDIEFHCENIIRNVIFDTYPLVIHGNGPVEYKQFMYNLFYTIKHNLYKVKYNGNILFVPKTLTNNLCEYGYNNPMVLHN